MKNFNTRLQLLVFLFFAIFILTLSSSSSIMSEDESQKEILISMTKGSLPTLPVEWLIKEISYLPCDYDWADFWPKWNLGVKDRMDEDLDLIQNVGANTVRLIIPPHIAGYPQPTQQFLNDFEDALTLISAHGLKAHVTLFDFDDFYPHPSDGEIPIADVIADSKLWLDAVVIPHQNDLRIAVWELHNEINLYYLEEGMPTNNPVVRAHQWLEGLFPYLKQKASLIPCTVSVSWVEWLNDLAALPTPPDIYNLHWYPDWKTWSTPLPGILDRAFQIIGIGQRLMVGEFGCNTHTFSDASQVDLYRDVLYYANQKGISDIGTWILNDFPAGRRNRDGILLPPSELYNGVYRIKSGNTLEPKPVVDLLREAFHGNLPQTSSNSVLLNTSFENLNLYSGNLENWLAWNQDFSLNPWYSQDCTQAHTGNCSVKLTPDRFNFIVGLASTPAIKTSLGASYVYSGYVKALPGTAVRLQLTWLDGNGRYLSSTDSSPAGDASDWQPIQMQGTVPGGAVYVIPAARMIDSLDNGVQESAWLDDLGITWQPRRGVKVDRPRVSP